MASTDSTKYEGNRFALLSLEPDDLEEIKSEYDIAISNQIITKKSQLISNIGSKVFAEKNSNHSISVDDILTNDQISDMSSVTNRSDNVQDLVETKIDSYCDSQQIPKLLDNEVSVAEEKVAKSLSLTDVRRTYDKLIKDHRELFTKELMTQLWNSWRNVTPEFPGTYVTKMAQIRGFVLNPDQKELILHDRASKHRFEYHQICSVLKLEHKSIIENVDDGLVEDEDPNEKWHVVGKHGKKDPVIQKHNKYAKYGPKMMGKDQRYEHFNKHKNEKPANAKQDVLKTLILTKPDNWCWEFTVVSPEQQHIDELKLAERVQKHREWVKVMKTKKCAKCTISAVESELFTTKTLIGLYCEKCTVLDEFTGHTFKHAYGRGFVNVN